MSDAHGDAEHGRRGDEGDEVIAPLGARVAQPDEELEGADHGGWEATDEEGRLGARGA